MTTSTRERNRRGEGGRLREEILAAAAQLLDETGREQDVTLRAVARRVGISAPSIYAHFPDRAAIVDTVVDAAFVEFNAAIAAAGALEPEPSARLRAGCAAYLRFADQQPNRYRLLFARRIAPADDGSPRPVAALRTDGLAALVAAVQACVDAGQSQSTDPAGDATAIWVALHGFATLHAGLPDFPWPETDVLLDRIVRGLARLTCT